MTRDISGSGHPGYEGTCQTIKSDVKKWFDRNPEKIEEAHKTDGFFTFLDANPEVRTIIGKYDPSLAQASSGFYAALEEVRGSER